MQTNLDLAMEQGALGLSSAGLAYASGKQANANEVMQLAKVLSGHGGIYTTPCKYRIYEEILSAMEEAFGNKDNTRKCLLVAPTLNVQECGELRVEPLKYSLNGQGFWAPRCVLTATHTQRALQH